MTLTVERSATAAPPASRPSAMDVIKLAKDAALKIVDLRPHPYEFYLYCDI